MILRLTKMLPLPFQKGLERVLDSPLAGRLARGAFWSLLGSVLARVLSTTSWVIVGRMLGKEGFGEIGMIQNTVGMFATAAAFGMGMATTKYVAEYRSTDPERAGRFIALASATNFITSVVLSLVLWFMAPWLASETLSAPHLVWPLQISALLLFFGGIAGAPTGALGGFEAFKVMAHVNVIVGIASFPLLVLGTWWGGVQGALWGLIGSSALNTALFWIVYRKEVAKAGITVRFKGCWEEVRFFWDFNLPGTLNTLLAGVVLWAVGAMLVRGVEGFGGLGVYNAAQRIRFIPENLVGMLLTPVLPVLVNSFAQKDMTTYARTLVFAFVISSVTIVPLALLQIASPWLTLLPYGSQFQGQEMSVIIWLMVGTIAYSLMWPMGFIFASLGRVWFALGVGVLQGGANLLLAAWLIPRFGSSGLAMSATLAAVIGSVPLLWLLYRELPFVMKQLEWPLMLAVTMLLCGICVSAWMILPLLPASCVGIICGVGMLVWRIRSAPGRWRDSAVGHP